ncbi:di-heme oxidoredictase family protein [Cellvibrio fontiphilus]|uniref:Di-heme oxidoredictase family protein n=1 Tax=Cellvibrio fontiphilus TaxID=1815559 RepID=A0ABV7FI85_9GAMM
MRITQFGRRMLLALVALSSVSAAAQTININPVSATGSTNLQPASYAIDNIGNTRWESNHGISPSSLTLDLGQVYNLSQVVILWEAANAERYEILGSNNNSTWTQLALRTGGAFGNRTDTVLLAGSYRYVRMNAITRSAGNNWGYSIFEMDVFGAVPVASSSSVSSANCALGCVTTLNSSTMRATVTGGDIVDIHYTVNGGAQQNVRMNLANGVWTYDIGGLPAGAVVRANFTIIKNGAGQDTEWKNYTLGAGSSSLPSSSRSSSSVPSSVAPSSSRPSSSSVAPPSSSSVASSAPLGNIVPLYNNTTALEPVIKFDRGDALVTRIADRARDRHAKENHFQAYDHYLTFYWEQRTATIEIVDYVAKGGTSVRMNVVTQGRLDDLQAENRWFYIGMNTLAEYCGNGVMNRINDFNYWKEASWNCRENRPIQIGDRLEFELSQFLDKNSVIRGRDNYYGTTYLYIVGQGIVPWDVTDKVPFVGGVYKQRDSMPMPVNARLGGDTSLHVQMTAEPDGHFQQMATNLSAVNGQAFVLGRRVHHTSFINGGHDENPENGIFSEMVGKSGTRYVSDRCSHCHERNGRAPVAAVGEALDRWVFKVGNAQGNPHPQMGRVLQPQANGGATSEGTPSIAFWTESGGLRSPNYQFTGLRPETFSARLAPQLVGIGLLEAIPESTILAREDINDANGDGISGRAQRIADPATGQTRLGRFGYKAATTSVKHQVASAFNTDMGVMTSMLPNPDCGSSQTNCGPSGSELANQHLDNLVKYVALLGVRPQRDYNNAQVINGRTVFNNIGCAGCHVESMTTSQYHPFAELRSQTIRPYTDMLLHDMGPGLADNLGEGQASGAEWRTAPLWGLGVSACVTGGVTGQPGGVPFGVDGNEVCVPKASYLHDGRARTIEEAILWHGGEGQNAKNNYSALSASQKQDLLRFLQSL